ncbi:alpha/beta hydrolase [Novosphingobium sp.]|uniref:alpha/beta fold hydrolase n=1 Tax=Novosphingobium sp. TaxID=1874826 RepID=UPI0025D9B7AC|nr:alpha/beta hydrolase [Novosphingobium sp.]
MSEAAWQSGTVPVSGGRIAWHRTGGPGPALVLSHGLSDNGLCWARLVELLPPVLDVVMLDARGHGGSSRFVANDAFEPARDIAEAMDGLGLQSAVIMGHSVGALAAARFAATYPERTRALILEDPPLLPQLLPAELTERRARFAEQMRGLQAMSDAEIVAVGRAQSPGWHHAEFPAWASSKRQVDPDARIALDRSWQEIFAAIRAPTLLLHGDSERGSMVDADAAGTAGRINPRIRLQGIAGAGHNVRRENLDTFAAAVNTFLAQELPEISGEKAEWPR